MWRTVELRELRLFSTLAEELHFGHTAERLQVTPSRVSQSLRALEHKLGSPLVHCTSRRVELTPFGEGFLRDVRPALEQLDGVGERLLRDPVDGPRHRCGRPPISLPVDREVHVQTAGALPLDQGGELVDAGSASVERFGACCPSGRLLGWFCAVVCVWLGGGVGCGGASGVVGVQGPA